MFRNSTNSCYFLMLHKTIRDNDLQPKNVALKVDTVEHRCTDSPRITESEKVLLQVGSGIHHTFAVKLRILGSRVRNTAQGIRNSTNDWNSKSKFHLKNPNLVPEIRNPRRGIQNPKLSWIPLHGAKRRFSVQFLRCQFLEFLNRLQVS